MKINKNKVLLIFNDVSIRTRLKESLFSLGYKVTEASNSVEGLKIISNEKPDLVLLDLEVPDMNGLETLQQLRSTSDAWVIILSTITNTFIKIEAFNHGASDYVTKPVELAELLARIEAVFRHEEMKHQIPSDPDFDDGQLMISLRKRHALVDGIEVELTPKEFKLLCELLINTNEVLTYQRILKNVWGPEYWDEKELVHSLIKRLRFKIEINPKKPQYIMAVKGVGYRFNSNS